METWLKIILTIVGIAGGAWAIFKGIPLLFADIKLLRHQTACRKELDDKFKSIHETVGKIDRRTEVTANDVAWIKRELNGGHGDTHQ